MKVTQALIGPANLEQVMQVWRKAQGAAQPIMSLDFVTVDSYGNGLAYVLHDHRAMRCILLQDDESTSRVDTAISEGDEAVRRLTLDYIVTLDPQSMDYVTYIERWALTDINTSETLEMVMADALRMGGVAFAAQVAAFLIRKALSYVLTIHGSDTGVNRDDRAIYNVYLGYRNSEGGLVGGLDLDTRGITPEVSMHT